MEELHPMGQIAAEGGPEAVSLVSELMEHSSREREWMERAVEAAKDAEIARWKERALQAEGHLVQIEHRLLGLLRYEPDFFQGEPCN